MNRPLSSRPTANNGRGFCDCGSWVTLRMTVLRNSILTVKTGCHRCIHREADRLSADDSATIAAFPIHES